MLEGILQDASKLVYRIQTALKGESGGLETAMLAWRYAAAVEEANRRLAICSEQLETQGDIVAYASEQFSPKLLEAVDALDFAESGAWRARCEVFGWRMASQIEVEKAKTLRSAFAKVEDLKEWLSAEFRKRARAKDKAKAFQIINLLKENFQEDLNIQEEFKRLRQGAVEQAENELQAAMEELLANESSQAILERYRAQGLEFSQKEGLIAKALQAETAALEKKAEELAKGVVDRREDTDDAEKWKDVEEAYLQCDTFLAITGTRATLETGLRGDFGDVGTALSRSRGFHESKIQIRNTIAELSEILKGKRSDSGKKLKPHDSIERLKSFEAQAKKVGYRLPKDLQQEIHQVLAEARKKRLPKLAFFYGGIAASFVFSLWVISYLFSGAKEDDLTAEALAALKDVSVEKSVLAAESVLKEWQFEIAGSEPNSPLNRAAQPIREWTEQQRALETEYSRVVDSIEKFKQQKVDKKSESEIEELIADASMIRQELSPELGENGDNRIKEFNTWLSGEINRRDQLAGQQIDQLRMATAEQLAQAESAQSLEEFETASSKTLDLLEQLIEAATTLPGNESTSISSSIESISSSLDGIRNKWDAFAMAQRKLSEAESLEDYLENLRRIQSFDILPRQDKLDIGRTLKRESALASLKQTLILPDADGWMEYAEVEEYRRAKPELSDVERVFLERLANDSNFTFIFQSKVKYFEGDAIAKSEYRVFLKDPITKSETGLKTGVNFAFQVRGFDEQGEAERQPREMNFLSHPDGTFWGFFYEPSDMAQESIYYEETLRVSLLQILAGAPRFTIIGMIEQLNKQRTLSPAFRAYWQEQLLTFMEMDPWKWGLTLSPTLAEQRERLSKVARGGISKWQWLSSIEQTSPSIEFIDYFRYSEKTRLVDEAEAFAALYQEALNGEFILAGHINAEGEVALKSEYASAEPIWTVNAVTGRIEKMDSEKQGASYAPLLTYRKDGQSATSLLQQTRFLTGLDLSQKPFIDHLPPLFR